MNYLKVLAILSLLFIFCGSVYGAGEADSPDINGVNAVIDDTITVENAGLTYDKLITSNNCEEVVIGDNSIWDVPIREGPIVENDNTSIPDITLKGENGNNMSFNNLQMFLSMNHSTSKWYLRIWGTLLDSNLIFS